jgi:hypothetical protein
MLFSTGLTGRDRQIQAKTLFNVLQYFKPGSKDVSINLFSFQSISPLRQQ